MDVCVGLGGVKRNACAALATSEGFLAACEQERVIRLKAAGVNPTGLPDEALDALLEQAGLRRGDVGTFGVGEPLPTNRIEPVHFGHHLAHACAAFLPSPFESATIVVCDHEKPQVSVWDGNAGEIAAVEWPWVGPGFAQVYSDCAEALGFTAAIQEQRMEALARFDPHHCDTRAAELFSLSEDGLQLPPDWQARLCDLAPSASSAEALAPVSAAVQARLGDLLVDFLRIIRRRRPERRSLCLGGSLFYNSYFNTKVKESGAFEDVFVPINPGNAGLSVGVALHLSRNRRRSVSAFLGPAYDAEEIKATLDNCKLKYTWESESDVIGIAVDTLRKGQLLGWFDGPMEWGPRALGGRSILANPFAPYALENLNRFLKHRPRWRGYALSGIGAAVHEYFDGPPVSPYMDCDYAPKDRTRFAHILPGPDAHVRIHTVGTGAPRRFTDLLDAFGQSCGIPIVVNTSFNGFREPIVCSPRDAVRVFFGSGIDTLIMDRFVLRK